MPNKIYLDLEKVKLGIKEGQSIIQLSKTFDVCTETISKTLKENNILY